MVILEQVNVVAKPDETWTIACTDKPTMSSIVLELAE